VTVLLPKEFPSWVLFYFDKEYGDGFSDR